MQNTQQIEAFVPRRRMITIGGEPVSDVVLDTIGAMEGGPVAVEPVNPTSDTRNQGEKATTGGSDDPTATSDAPNSDIGGPGTGLGVNNRASEVTGSDIGGPGTGLGVNNRASEVTGSDIGRQKRVKPTPDANRPRACAREDCGAVFRWSDAGRLGAGLHHCSEACLLADLARDGRQRTCVVCGSLFLPWSPKRPAKTCSAGCDLLRKRGISLSKLLESGQEPPWNLMGKQNKTWRGKNPPRGELARRPQRQQSGSTKGERLDRLRSDPGAMIAAWRLGTLPDELVAEVKALLPTLPDHRRKLKQPVSTSADGIRTRNQIRVATGKPPITKASVKAARAAKAAAAALPTTGYASPVPSPGVDAEIPK